MKKTWRVVTSVILIAFAIIGFGKFTGEEIRYRVKSYLKTNKDYKEQRVMNQPEVPGYQLLASNTARGVYVYGKKLDSAQYFNQILVKTKTSQKQFNWTATARSPVLTFADVTGSGEENIVIIFITAYGTGLLKSDVHIVNMSLTREIPVDDPVTAAQRLITSRIEGQEIVFRAGGKEYRVRPIVGAGGIQGEYKNLEYGNVVTYRVEGNRLIATVGVQTNPFAFLGEFTLVYSYRGGRLVPQVMNFKKFD